jgi:hypothetical protein
MNSHVHEQFMNMKKKEKIDNETVSKVRKEFTGKGPKKKSFIRNLRAHPGSNWGPIDLQSIALPLSYTPGQ